MCAVINYSNRLIFADNLEVYRSINSPSDSLLLQSDTDCVLERCSANFMTSNSCKTTFFYQENERFKLSI
jgi:hypothetical protein